MEQAKWCDYCQKDTHNDAECWCTRPVGWKRGFVPATIDSVARLIAQRHDSPRANTNTASLSVVGAVADRYSPQPR